MKFTREEIVNDLEGFFSQSLQFDPSPTIKHKKVKVTIVCTPLSSGVGWGGGGVGGIRPRTKFSKSEGP